MNDTEYGYIIRYVITVCLQMFTLFTSVNIGSE